MARVVAADADSRFLPLRGRNDKFFLRSRIGLFLAGRAEEGKSPAARCEEGTEENYGVDAGSSLGRPVDVLQVQPESKFVERQSCTYAVEDRHEAAEEKGRIVLAGADVGQPSVSHGKKNDDAEDQVMNVAPAMLDEM